MSFTNDWIKLLIFEAQPGKQLNSLAWNAWPEEDITGIDYMEYANDAAARAAYVTDAGLPTGGTITTSGTKRIHTFTANGTFALPAGVSGNVEVLVIGGGGGGARISDINGCGGGGGGAAAYSAALALSAGESVAVTVGAGGAGRTGSTGDGTNGSDSTFKTLTGVGGGGGGDATGAGLNGGTGGGGGTSGATSLSGGTGSVGGNGGSGFGSAVVANRAGGGGGGAGGNGQNASSGTGGNGGAGYNSSISGASVNYGGGGGGASQGGTQGSGVDGGGNGSQTTTGGSGANGLGGGGGGGADDNNGGNGGSGVVIVSYVLADFYALQSFSESTIKTQGSYSLKGVAKQTGSLNLKLTRTVSPTIDLTGCTSIEFDIRASRTGSNIKIGLHDAGGTTTEITPNVLVADTWQTVEWDISAVADADKNAIDSIIITIVNADADNTFYLDNLYAYLFPVFYMTNINIGEIVKVEEDGSPLTMKETVGECVATASSFYHDFFGKRLYVHLANGDSPGGFTSPDYNHDVVAFVWKCFANRQGENGNTISYIPEGCKYPHFYEPSLRSGSLSELSAAIADHFESAMQTTFGSISIANNEAKWYSEVDDWYWGNKEARALVGQPGDAYADLTRIFVGRVKSPVVSDEEVAFDFVDTREGRLQSIPPDHYSTDDYPNLESDAEGQPIPILFGEKKNITPACIDTTAHKYKVTQTEFNGGADVFEQQALDAVYLKGVALSLTTHYTVDLANGEFTLTFDPADAEITCDAKGIKDGFDFSSSPFGAATGVYSENVADHLFFVLHILNQIPVDEFNLDSFAELQAVRTQAVAWYLNEDMATLDFNRMLQQTSLYHFLPLADGTFAARYYRRTVPEGSLELRDYDYAGFKKSRPNEGVFRDVFLRYDKDPTTGDWKQLVNTEATVQHRHGTKDPYVVDTALRAIEEAENVLEFYVELLKNPPTKITTTTSMIARSTIPTDKIYINRKVNADGHEVTICQDEVNVILEARKNIESGTVELVMQLDTQLAIYTLHADIAHQDVPHEDHSDTVHSDSDHGNSHTDTDHVDTPYGDASYSDHDDAEHEDHSDVVPPLHVDEPHEDHTDNTHTDTAHGNVAYADVPHVDTSHVDHSDTIHEDAHTDVAHVDSEV